MPVQAYQQGGGFYPEYPQEDRNVKKLNTNREGEEKRSKKRRGKGKSRTSSFSILLVNLRGYRSKEYSLKKALKKY